MKQSAQSDEFATLSAEFIENGVVLKTGGSGDVIAGFADRRALRFAFGETRDDDPFAAACRGIMEAIERNDPAVIGRRRISREAVSAAPTVLRRLAVAEAVLKAGYNPDEPRDAQGRWTSGETGAAGTATGAGTIAETAPLLGELGANAAASLAEIGSAITVPATILGIIFIPTNKTLISEGTLPNRPDIAWRFDRGEGTLWLTQHDAGGSVQALSRFVLSDSVFRDAAGSPIARYAGGSLIFDPAALPGYASVSADQDGGSLAASPATVDAKNGEPQLCPDPEPDKPGGRSEAAIAYQAFVNTIVNPDPVTQLRPSLAVRLWNPERQAWVYFDDCYRTTGTMVDAKGPGYSAMMNKGSDYPWKGVVDKMLDQAARQTAAAGDRDIIWYFAEKDVADRIKKLLHDRGLTKITVRHLPAQWVSR